MTLRRVTKQRALARELQSTMLKGQDSSNWLSCCPAISIFTACKENRAKLVHCHGATTASSNLVRPTFRAHPGRRAATRVPLQHLRACAPLKAV